MGLFTFPDYQDKGCRAKKISGHEDIRSIVIIMIIVKIIMSPGHLFKVSTFNRVSSVMLLHTMFQGRTCPAK